MEPVYSEWRPVIDGHNRRQMIYCPYCERGSATMMKRYMTNRDGETEQQFRVECPVCNNTGKVYLHMSVAELSWGSRENDPPKEDYLPHRKRRMLFIKEGDG